MEKFSHINEEGKAHMVDVGDKAIQQRMAKAKGRILLNEKTLELIKQNEIKKGDVLTVAEIAGIQAAKHTANLIPLCHNLLLTKIHVQATIIDEGVEVESRVHCQGQTGVEMEALTAVSVALLTIYDMCKAVDKAMIMEAVQLVEKTKK